MKLEDAYTLLESQGRIMAEVAKHYNWKDDADLKEYTDFILHEPIQWMKGYPVKYAQESQFGKPKTALVKLLKNETVQAEYGIEYTSTVREAVWKAYKQIVKSEKSTNVEEGHVDDHVEDHIVDHTEEPMLTIVEEDIDVASVHSMRRGKKLDRSAVLANALRAFIQAEAEKNPGLAAVSLTLLDAFLTS
jgi:hypothetical protein